MAANTTITISTGWIVGALVSNEEISVSIPTVFTSVVGNLRIISGAVYVRQNGYSYITNASLGTDVPATVSLQYPGCFRLVFNPPDDFDWVRNNPCNIFLSNVVITNN